MNYCKKHGYFISHNFFQCKACKRKMEQSLMQNSLFIQQSTIILYTCVTKHDFIVLACRHLDFVNNLTSSIPFVTESRVNRPLLAPWGLKYKPGHGPSLTATVIKCVQIRIICYILWLNEMNVERGKSLRGFANGLTASGVRALTRCIFYVMSQGI